MVYKTLKITCCAILACIAGMNVPAYGMVCDGCQGYVSSLSEGEAQSLSEKLTALVPGYVEGKLTIAVFANLTEKERIVLKDVLKTFAQINKTGVLPSWLVSWGRGLAVVFGGVSTFAWFGALNCLCGIVAESCNHVQMNDLGGFQIWLTEGDKIIDCVSRGFDDATLPVIWGIVTALVAINFCSCVEESTASELFLKKLDEIHWFVFNSALSY